MIEIQVLQNAATVDVEGIAWARMDDEGNLLVGTSGIRGAIRSPMAQPWQEGESIWRYVERAAAAAAMTEEGFNQL